MAWKEKPIEKIYFRIGEASQIVGAPSSTIRFWLTKFEIDVEVKRARHNSPHGANRKLTAKDLNKLFEIKRLLQVEGLHIWAAKKRMKQTTEAA